MYPSGCVVNHTWKLSKKSFVFLIIAMYETKMKSTLRHLFANLWASYSTIVIIFSTFITFFSPFSLCFTSLIFYIISFSIRYLSTNKKLQCAIWSSILMIICSWFVLQINQARTTSYASSCFLGCIWRNLEFLF
jgi:uncharacterized membrane protein